MSGPHQSNFLVWALSYVGFDLEDRAELRTTLKIPRLSSARPWELGQKPELSIKTTSGMAQPMLSHAASSELFPRACMNLGTCDLATSTTARDRADGMEGLSPASCSQPGALSLQLGGSHILPSTTHRTPERNVMGCQVPSNPAVAGWDCFDFGCAGENLRQHPYPSNKTLPSAAGRTRAPAYTSTNPPDSE